MPATVLGVLTGASALWRPHGLWPGRPLPWLGPLWILSGPLGGSPQPELQGEGVATSTWQLPLTSHLGGGDGGRQTLRDQRGWQGGQLPKGPQPATPEGDVWCPAHKPEPRPSAGQSPHVPRELSLRGACPRWRAGWVNQAGPHSPQALDPRSARADAKSRQAQWNGVSFFFPGIFFSFFLF